MSSTEPTRYFSSFSASVEKSGIVASSATLITMPPHTHSRLASTAAQATQVTITARGYCAGSSIGKTRERARTFVLRLVEMITVIRKEASGRPDLTAEVSDAVARGDAFVTGAPGVSVWAFGRCSHACDGARYSLSPGHRAATCENTSSPAWKTCRLVRSMRRVTCCPAIGLPSQIWRPAPESGNRACDLLLRE